MSALALAAWGVLKPYALKVLLVLAVIVTVLGVLAKAKRAGVVQERTEAAIATAKNVQRQDRAAAAAPHTVSEVSKSMREGTF